MPPHSRPPAAGRPHTIVHLVLVAAMLVLATSTMPDPDLWGHIRYGGDIVDHGRVAVQDTYSFSSDRNWINHEWLAEVLMYSAFGLGGTSGLIGFKALMAIGMFWVVWLSVRRFSPDPAGWNTALAIALVGTIWRINTMRPQLFSLLLFAVLLLALSEAGRGRTRALLAVPAVMCVWANTHGGWLVGVGTLAVWAAVSVAERRHNLRQSTTIGAAVAAGVLATLVNPYGVGLWSFLRETVGLRRPDIIEWWPISALPLGAAVPWLVSLVAGIFVISRSRQPLRRADVAIVVMLAVASFRVSRLDAFFALGVVILLAPEFAACWRRPYPAAGLGGTGAAALVTGMAALVVAVPTFKLMQSGLTCVQLDGGWLPEREAIEFMRHHNLQGRLLNWFDWGEYASWHLGPGLQVSIDGRRETAYSDTLLAQHHAFYRAEGGAAAFAQTMRADYIWLPQSFPVVAELRRQGWQAVFDGPVSVVFTRRDILLAGADPGPLGATPDGVASPRRCFPGP